MSDLTVSENKELSAQEQIVAIRDLFDPGRKLSDIQVKIFLDVAKKKNLDPFAKQICCRPAWNKAKGKNDLVIITQIDGFRAVAERTGNYAPGRATEYAYGKDGRLVSATAYVKKLTRDGTWHEVAETCFMREFQATGMGWANMPHVMLSKCAEARALRRAFPEDLSGLYSNEEMDQAKEDTLQEVQDESVEFLSEKKVEFLRHQCQTVKEVFDFMDNFLKKKGIKTIAEIPADKWDEVLEGVSASKKG